MKCTENRFSTFAGVEVRTCSESKNKVHVWKVHISLIIFLFVESCIVFSFQGSPCFLSVLPSFPRIWGFDKKSLLFGGLLCNSRKARKWRSGLSHLDLSNLLSSTPGAVGGQVPARLEDDAECTDYTKAKGAGAGGLPYPADDWTALSIGRSTKVPVLLLLRVIHQKRRWTRYSSPPNHKSNLLTDTIDTEIKAKRKNMISE